MIKVEQCQVYQNKPPNTTVNPLADCYCLTSTIHYYSGQQLTPILTSYGR